MYDVIILGSGPAGLTAALYCGRAGKNVIVMAGTVLGGQTAEIALLENYPGWHGTGFDLIEFMKKQAESFGAKITMNSAAHINTNDNGTFTITDIHGKKHDTRSVILATGASPKKLEIDGARELFGRGVSYCATCDGFFYTDKTVLVIGGGNSALNDALYLADIAKTVKIIYRKSEFTRAEDILRKRVAEKKNIECIFNTELKKIAPKPDSENGELVATTTDAQEILCDGVFVAIGHEANTDYLTEEIKRDDMGRIAPSSLPSGMFVAGDIYSNMKMQVATAVGTGCTAAMDAISYLNANAE